jgi:hypothetical protein
LLEQRDRDRGDEILSPGEVSSVPSWEGRVAMMWQASDDAVW